MPAKLRWKGGVRKYKRKVKGRRHWSKYTPKLDAKRRGHKFVKFGQRSRGSKFRKHYPHTGDGLGENV